MGNHEHSKKRIQGFKKNGLAWVWSAKGNRYPVNAYSAHRDRRAKTVTVFPISLEDL